MRVGLIGCGALGSYIATAIENGTAGDYEMVAVYDHYPSLASTLAEALGCTAAETVEALLDLKPEIVIEAARREAVWSHAETCISGGASIIVLSSGAFADEGFKSRLTLLAKQHGRKIYVPAGAVGGLDLLQAAATGKYKAHIATSKPPAALIGAPFVKDVDLKSLTAPAIVFSGSVYDGIDAFPQNINVAVSTALATGDLSSVSVSVDADPSLSVNVHRITVEGDFGKASVEIASRAIPSNPKSSALAAMSVLALLRKIESPFQVG